MSEQKPVAWDEPVAWIRQRDNTLALSDGGVFGDDWTPLYSAALAQPEQEPTARNYSLNDLIIMANSCSSPDWPEWWSDEDALERFAALVAVAKRKPLTEEEIELAYREIWRNLSDGFSHTSAEWIEAGIRYAEKVHGIE